MIKKAELASISTFAGTPPFHNDMNILMGIMIDGKLITHVHCLPRIITSIFKQMPGIHRQGIARMFAHEIVREIKLNNCLEFGEIDMSDVFGVVRLKYPMLVMKFLDGISIFQNLCTGNYEEEWQDTDSGYLNCIGVGDTYVKKQIARILSQNKLTADYVSWFTHKNGIEAYTDNVEFKNKES